MSDEPKMEVPVQEWATMKVNISHIENGVNEIKKDLKEFKDGLAHRISILENWKSAEEGAGKLKNFWIPIITSGSVAFIVVIANKIFK